MSPCARPRLPVPVQRGEDGRRAHGDIFADRPGRARDAGDVGGAVGAV